MRHTAIALHSLMLVAVVAGCRPADTASLKAPEHIHIDAMPSFIVECRNTSKSAVNPVAALEALQLDGKTIDARAVIGSALGGFPPDVAPGGTWRHLVVLQIDSIGNRSNESAGAAWRDDRRVTLTPGKHTIAIQCAGNWTAPMTFTSRGSRR